MGTWREPEGKCGMCQGKVGQCVGKYGQLVGKYSNEGERLVTCENLESREKRRVGKREECGRENRVRGKKFQTVGKKNNGKVW